MIIQLSDKNLTKIEKKEISELLKREDIHLKTDVEQMWHLVDLIWDDFKCDNEHLNWENIGKFYSHPVWLLNGLFIEQDAISIQHRDAISNWIVKNKFKSVVDYGGGFGTLARNIAKKDNQMNVFIYEPYPSDFGLKRAREFSNIVIIDKLSSNYDCVISTDVLEHVSDPLNDFSSMIKSVKAGGFLVIANAFFPMVKCHLPQNFHFRYSFNTFAKMMGIEMVGVLEGSHATIFKKIKDKEQNWTKIRFYEKLSKVTFPIMKLLIPIFRVVKKLKKIITGNNK